jgi:hypothetical protein
MATSFRPHVPATTDENAFRDTGIGVREQVRLPQRCRTAKISTFWRRRSLAPQGRMVNSDAPTEGLLMGWSGRALALPASVARRWWGFIPGSTPMTKTATAEIAVIGSDIGKSSFHVVGLDKQGAIVLRQKWSRGQGDGRRSIRAQSRRGRAFINPSNDGFITFQAPLIGFYPSGH